MFFRAKNPAARDAGYSPPKKHPIEAGVMEGGTYVGGSWGGGPPVTTWVGSPRVQQKNPSKSLQISGKLLY